jgi:hypothetical protein
VGYGFCLGASKIVRLRVGQNGGVGSEGWSFGQGREVGRRVFGGKISDGLDWIGVSEDTKGIGVEGPRVESRMDGWLGSIKNETPSSKVACTPGREGFYDEHRGGTVVCKSRREF